MDYRDSRAATRPHPPPPVTGQAPGMALFVNYPPDENEAFRDVLALYCPVFTMFAPPQPDAQRPGRFLAPEFKPIIAEEYGPYRGSYLAGLSFDSSKETIVGWFPHSKRPSSVALRWTLNELGLQDDLSMDPPFFISTATRYADLTPEGAARHFVHADPGMAKAKCLLAAIDSRKREVYKAETRKEWRDGAREGEEVEGLLNAIWKLSKDGLNLAEPGMIVGGIMKVVPLTINYQKGKSALSTSGLLPPAGESAADYLVKVSRELIAAAGKINTLLNVLQDFQLSGPRHPQVIPRDLKIEIGGHTDRTGTEAGNKALSQERAAAIVKFLLEHCADFVAYAGRADTQDFLSERLVPAGHGWNECPAEGPADNPKARKISFRIQKPPR